MSVRRSRSDSKRASAWLGNAVLNVLAVLGVLCIVLVILSVVFNVSIMMFKTGSMSPTIPAGSIAVVREIPAEEMEIGDIITASRGENVLPVTHRVVDIDSTDEATGAVTFEMRGDANAEKDPDLYTAEVVRKVMFSVPGVAPVLQKWRNPYLLGGITVAASLLVVWAFWPRRGDDEDESKDSLEPRDQENPGFDSQAQMDSLHEARASARSPRHAIVFPAIAVLLLGGSGLFSGCPIAGSESDPTFTASADHVSSSEVHGDVLRMQAFGDDAQMRSLSPGASASWSVDVWADAPDPGSIDLEIGAVQLSEPFGSAVTVDVTSCALDSAAKHCPPGSESLLQGVPLVDLGQAPNDGRWLLEMNSDEERRVEVRATLSPDADGRSVAGLTSSVRLTATGLGDEISMGPGEPGPDDPGGSGELPWTGIRGWQWILLAAFVLVVVGSAIVARTRRRRVSS